MSDDLLRYDVMVQDALRSVVRKVLKQTEENGLPEPHHFYISFDTLADGVDMSDALMARYPEEMTIVLQHQFENLKVWNDAFEVTLHFDGKAERIYVPLAAIKGFVDPGVQFGLQFETGEGDDDIAEDPASDGLEELALDSEEAEEAKGEVITLDAFRKK